MEVHAAFGPNADAFAPQAASSRRLSINWAADLSHHRTYGSVYGGSLVFTYFGIIKRKRWISKPLELLYPQGLVYGLTEGDSPFFL